MQSKDIYGFVRNRGIKITIICHSYQFVFVHIPRTGGTSINVALESLPDTRICNHAAAASIHRYFGRKVARYSRFSFVRNPWGRLYSYYCKMRSRGHPHDPTISAWKCKIPRSLSFEECVLNHPLPESQLDWVTDHRGKIVVDFIGRYERLQEDFDEVCDLFKIERRILTRENRFSRKPYRRVYTDEMREKVAQEYAKSIKFFGYEF